jgi:hypothetical protein
MSSADSNSLPVGYRRLSSDEQSRAKTYGQRCLDAARANRPTGAGPRSVYDANVIGMLERVTADFSNGRTAYLGDLILKAAGSSDPSSAPLPRAVQAGGYGGRTLHEEWRPAAATSAPPSPARPSASSPPPAAKATTTPTSPPPMPTPTQSAASPPATAAEAWQRLPDSEKRQWLNEATFASDFDRTRRTAMSSEPSSTTQATDLADGYGKAWAAMTPAEQSAWFNEATYVAAMRIEDRQRRQNVPMGP